MDLLRTLTVVSEVIWKLVGITYSMVKHLPFSSPGTDDKEPREIRASQQKSTSGQRACVQCTPKARGRRRQNWNPRGGLRPTSIPSKLQRKLVHTQLCNSSSCLWVRVTATGSLDHSAAETHSGPISPLIRQETAAT